MSRYLLGVLTLFISLDLFAARCKIDGEWYPYDSPQCNPGDPETSESTIPAQQEPILSPPPDPTTPSYIEQREFLDYMRPWNQVAYKVENLCSGKQVYGFKNSCRVNEEIGYWAMHGNFNMPEDIAHNAKVLCAGKTDSFYSQSMCMQSESRGFRIFYLKPEIPPDDLNEARTKCLLQHESYQVRGSCMASAEGKYKRKSSSVPEKRGTKAVYAVGRRQLPLGYSNKSDIANFTIDPSSQPVHKIIGGDEPPPEPLHVSQRAYHLDILSADFPTMEAFQTHMEQSTEYSILTISEPLVKDRAYLSFSVVNFMDPKRGARFVTESKGVAVLHLLVEAGYTYLVDFVVTSWGTSSYRVAAESNEHVIEDLGGSYNHVIALLKATGPGWTRVSLRQDYGTGYQLHAVAVTSTEKK